MPKGTKSRSAGCDIGGKVGSGGPGFKKTIQILRRTALGWNSRFEPELEALRGIIDSGFPPGVSATVPVPAAAGSETAEELRVRLDNVATRTKKTGETASLLKERLKLILLLFNTQSGIPDDSGDAFFIEFLRYVRKLLTLSREDAAAAPLLDAMCLRYAEYCRERMAGANSSAEQIARHLPPEHDRAHKLAEVLSCTRAALSFGAQGIAALAGMRGPVPVIETLYAGFEKRVEESFSIEDGSLESISSDGKTAWVRIDRRFDLVKRITFELCRSFVRIGAFEKARTCEQLLDTMAIGYTPVKRSSPVSFEEENWRMILAETSRPLSPLAAGER